VLLKEFTQTLYSVADDVYMNVEFNPEYVKEYRLIGFDNKVGALRDASSIVEGGEIGSGFSMIAMFEIEPAELNRNAVRDSIYSGQLANIRLQYRNPGDTTHRYFDRKSNFDYTPYDKLAKCYQFSAAVAQFGSMLRGSPFVKTKTWNDMVLMAQASATETDLLQKEFVNLTILARNLYMKGKKRKVDSH
jgi:Ca-activated chloride channel homolog